METADNNPWLKYHEPEIIAYPYCTFRAPDWLHAQGTPVNVEKCLHLLHFRGFLLADPDQLPQRLDIKTGGIGFLVNILDVGAQSLTLFLQTFDTFDYTSQPVGGIAAGLQLVRIYWFRRNRAPLP